MAMTRANRRHIRLSTTTTTTTTYIHTYIHSALLPDFATLCGNDYFAPTDRLSGQSKGFVKKVTVPLRIPPSSSAKGCVFGECACTWSLSVCVCLCLSVRLSVCHSLSHIHALSLAHTFTLTLSHKYTHTHIAASSNGRKPRSHAT